MDKWFDTSELGPLFLEKTLVTFDIPELFLCVDASGDNKYLVLLLDKDNEMYLCVPVTNQTIHNVLQGQIPLETAFQKAKDGRAYYITAMKLEYSVKRVKISQVPSEHLPRKGVLLNIQIFDEQQLNQITGVTVTQEI